jgi:hypothetical protein
VTGTALRMEFGNIGNIEFENMEFSNMEFDRTVDNDRYWVWVM